ncbi:MBL fold metallo-hydrolase [Halarcobacter ebronensis]|nr:MBL fold metallo-hydrolase [Halarcobacter ebronensis]
MVECSQNKESIEYKAEHYQNRKFRNLEIDYNSDFGEFFSNLWAFLNDKTENKIPEENSIPIVKLTKDDTIKMPNNSVVRLVHSTLLFKVDNRYILTDPVFSDMITPFPIAAPKRFHELPITIEELPFIDIVIISHNHYDHLDEPSIKKLKDKVGHFYTTLGVKQLLLDFGVDTMKVCELDWWQSCTVNGIKVAATPAQHFSGRGLFDRDKTLWASWVISTSNINVFFSADTGYFNGLKKIGEKYGPFDMTFIEVGAYNERWKEIHMMPNESIQAHKDLAGKVFFPIHNSSFKLSFHPWNEPLNLVVDIAKKEKIEIRDPKMGEIISILEPKKTAKWWGKD